MKCEDVNESLAAYLDREISPEERRQIETHLATCEKCREELRILTFTQNGLRQALGARVVGVEPSPQVWDKVRQRIESRNALWEKVGSIMARPAWRAAIPIVTVLIVVGALFGSGVLPGFQKASTPTSPIPTPTPAPMPAPPPPFEVSVVPEEAYYLPGEPVEVKFSLTNVSSEAITLEPYLAEIQVTPRLDYDRVLLSVAGGTQTLEINPGDTVTQEFTWDQKDTGGNQVSPGWYNVSFSITVRQGDTRIGFNPGARVLVQYPQGAMEKNLDVNQSQTVNGITVTLQRIELTSTGMLVYAFNTPPGYSLPPGQRLPAPSMMFTIEAECTVDGGAFKKAGSSGIRPLENGVLHVWGGEPANLDPVPSDAKELTFTITKLGDTEGPWEFRIPLE